MLIFKNLNYKNFLSTGNQPIHIDLNRSKTTLVTGHNGSGKTTMLEALCYVLYGKPYRKGIKLSGLINTTNKNNLLVEQTFETNGVEYKVIRGQKPNKFEIYENDELIEKTANTKDYQVILDNIIGIDYALFTQIIVLNKSRFVPFMQLDPKERRKVVEDILDLSIFSNMNKLNSESLKLVKNKCSGMKYDIDMKSKDLEYQKRMVESASSSIETDILALEQESDLSQADITKYSKSLVKLDKQITEKLDEVTDHSSITNDINKLKTYGTRIVSNIENIEKQKKFYDQDDCPTCGQEIDESVKTHKCNEFDKDISKMKSGLGELQTQMSGLLHKDKILSNINNTIKRLQNDRYEINANISPLKRNISNIKDKILKLKEDNNLQEYIDCRDELQSEYEDMLNDYEVILSENRCLSNVSTMLKDNGIKAHIVKDYLPLINSKINEYLQAMNYYTAITLDEEFNEHFVNPSKESFVYSNLSAGQQTRFDLAILLAWLFVAESKNSVKTNLLFTDEIFEALDADSLQIILKMFGNVLVDKNLFVITQRGDEVRDLFRSELSFKLVDDFTVKV